MLRKKILFDKNSFLEALKAFFSNLRKGLSKNKLYTDLILLIPKKQAR